MNLLNTPWYATAEPTGDNTELYRAYAPQAEALVLAELPELNGVISRQQPDRDGKLGRVWISYRVNETMLSIPVKHKQFKWLKKAEVGTPVAIRVTDDTEQSRVLTLKKRQGDTWDIFEPFSGRFRARGTIGFVKDDASRREVFIPPYLVSEHKLADGQVISGRAEYSLDRKKQQMGWKAVIVSQVG